MTALRLPSLLVITELPPVRYWVQGQLEKQFFLIHAASETKAFEVVQTAHLDFIIIDAALEECNPIELCEKIRTVLHGDPIPLLLITGRLKKTYRTAAMKAGVTDFLSDSLDNEELKMHIAMGIKASAARQKIAELFVSIGKPKVEWLAESFKNKRSLQDRMVQFLDFAKNEKIQVTMLLAQIDDFSATKATFGPAFTEEVLLPLSNLLSKTARHHFIVTPDRNGQFIILLTGANLTEIKKIARQFQQAIYAHPFSLKQGLHKLTASFALSKIDADKKALNKMVIAATASLADLSRKKNSILTLKMEKKK